MNSDNLLQSFEKSPIVAAIKDDSGLCRCMESDSQIIFVLYGNINTINDIVKHLKDAGKTVFVHVDLLDGLAPREVTIEFLMKNTCLDGIISTKLPLIKCAKNLGLMTVMRFFVIDNLSLRNIRKKDYYQYADMIEILPGLMPKIIRQISEENQRPVIAGGLISEKSDIVTALTAGAVAISSTDQNVWFM